MIRVKTATTSYEKPSKPSPKWRQFRLRGLSTWKILTEVGRPERSYLRLLADQKDKFLHFLDESSKRGIYWESICTLARFFFKLQLWNLSGRFINLPSEFSGAQVCIPCGKGTSQASGAQLSCVPCKAGCGTPWDPWDLGTFAHFFEEIVRTSIFWGLLWCSNLVKSNFRTCSRSKGWHWGCPMLFGAQPDKKHPYSNSFISSRYTSHCWTKK